MATTARGGPVKARRFRFTWNDYTPSSIESLKTLNATYLIYGRVLAPDGTDRITPPHLRGFMLFQHPRSLSNIRNTLRGCEVTVAAQTTANCIRYCEKVGTDEGNVEEWGCRPVTTRPGTGYVAHRFAPTATTTSSAAAVSGGTKGQHERILDILEANGYEPMSVYKADPILYGNNASFVQTICKAERKLLETALERDD